MNVRVKFASVGVEGTNYCPAPDTCGHLASSTGMQPPEPAASSQVAVASRFIGSKQSASLKVNYHGCNQSH